MGAKIAVICCCYPHISALHFPVSNFGWKTYNVLKNLNTENSENNGIKIPRHFFSYACNGFDLQLKETAAHSFYERAVIERFRKRNGILGKACI